VVYLVARLLAEHDRRRATGYATRHRAALETVDPIDGPFPQPAPA
jgi:hypothetical protein